MNKESKLNLNAGDYAISHCDSNKTYNGLEVHKMLCDAYIAGNNDTLDDKDERIRKALINVFATHKDYEMFFGVSVKDIRAWLEEQGEQKPIDKIKLGKIYKCVASPRYSTFMKGQIYKPEDKFLCSLMNFCSDCFEPIEDGEQKPIDKVKPKFKIGDWICNDVCIIHIASIENGMYYFDEGDGLSIEFTDNRYHLWTIQDAMDGDILFLDLMDGKTFIYNGISPNMEILYSSIISNDGEELLSYNIGKPNTGIGTIEDNKNIIYPATKEQRDLLFQKMHEAGYEWDAEKKELKEIEKQSIEIPFGAKDSELQEVTYYIPGGFYARIEGDKVVIKKSEQKPYGQREECLDCQFNYAGECKGSCAMKRDEQKLTEWSEEDNKWIENLIQTFEDGYLEGFNQLKSYGVIDWLKSFLDTLEVKEVDLEGELNNWRHEHFHGKRDQNAAGEYLKRNSQLDLAKYFFELGLNAQKG